MKIIFTDGVMMDAKPQSVETNKTETKLIIKEENNAVLFTCHPSKVRQYVVGDGDNFDGTGFLVLRSEQIKYILEDKVVVPIMNFN